jgi:hypothetical protein
MNSPSPKSSSAKAGAGITAAIATRTAITVSSDISRLTLFHLPSLPSGARTLPRQEKELTPLSRTRHACSVLGGREVCIWHFRALFVVLSGYFSYSPFEPCTRHLVPLRAFGTYSLREKGAGTEHVYEEMKLRCSLASLSVNHSQAQLNSQHGGLGAVRDL